MYLMPMYICRTLCKNKFYKEVLSCPGLTSFAGTLFTFSIETTLFFHTYIHKRSLDIDHAKICPVINQWPCCHQAFILCLHTKIQPTVFLAYYDTHTVSNWKITFDRLDRKPKLRFIAYQVFSASFLDIILKMVHIAKLSTEAQKTYYKNTNFPLEIK